MAGVLRTVSLFAGLSDTDLAALESRTTTVDLDHGDLLFSEGDAGDTAYIITSGAIEITKQTGDRVVLLAVRTPGDVIGEMALLQDSPRTATAVAKDRTSLVRVPKAEMDELMATSADAVRALFGVLLERWQSTQALLAQNERMVQLGTLTAGLAHEMNNPSAAAGRAAGQLRNAVEELRHAERHLGATMTGERRTAVDELLSDTAARRPSVPLGALELSDLEAELEDRLVDAGVADAWRLGPALAEAGLADTVDQVLEAAGADSGAVFEVLAAAQSVGSLAREIEEGTRRLSALVKALKSYSYLDQGPVQTVDLVSDLEDTLLILAPKLRGIEVTRRYGDDVGTIEAYGAELNQVWTNLLDNAADAIADADRPGHITITVRRLDRRAVVEISDDGVAIPDAAMGRLFDAFFTTKPPGRGTGQGLNISYGIVVHRHRGAITAEQQDGIKTFRVEIPVTT